MTTKVWQGNYDGRFPIKTAKWLGRLLPELRMATAHNAHTEQKSKIM